MYRIIKTYAEAVSSNEMNIQRENLGKPLKTLKGVESRLESEFKKIRSRLDPICDYIINDDLKLIIKVENKNSELTSSDIIRNYIEKKSLQNVEKLIHLEKEEII